MKSQRTTIVLCAVLYPVWLTMFILELTGVVCLSYNGFAVDEQGRLYLGRQKRIDVIDKGVVVDEYDAPFRGYALSFSNGLLIVDLGDERCILDSTGRIVLREEDHEYTNKHSFVSENGTRYIMRNVLLRPSIYMGQGEYKELLYQMPIFDYVVKILMCILVPVHFGLILNIVWKTRGETIRKLFKMGNKNAGNGFDSRKMIWKTGDG